MCRRLFHLAAALSLLLFIAAAILYTRSLFTADYLYSNGNAMFSDHIASGRGMLVVEVVEPDKEVLISPHIISRRSYRHAALIDFDDSYGQSFPTPTTLPPPIIPKTFGSPPADIDVPRVTYRWHFPGIVAGQYHFVYRTGTAFSISYLYLLALTAPLPLLWLRPHLRTRSHRLPGQCPSCGDHLRADKPGDKCPECGSPVESRP